MIYENCENNVYTFKGIKNVKQIKKNADDDVRCALVETVRYVKSRRRYVICRMYVCVQNMHTELNILWDIQHLDNIYMTYIHIYLYIFIYYI